MTQRWLLTDREDSLLQGISCEAQVMYMRVFRRYANFDTGLVTVTSGILKRVCEFIPDNGSKEQSRRVSDLTTHWVRARIAELERVQLIEKRPKQNKFDEPVFCCPLAVLGQVRPEKEPQRNRKEGTASEPPDVASDQDRGTAKEPQGGNRNIPGIPEDSEAIASGAIAPGADFKSMVWNHGAQYLGNRALIAKLIKTHGEANVFHAIAQAVTHNPADPKAYIHGILRVNGHGRPTAHQSAADKRAAINASYIDAGLAAAGIEVD